MDVLLFRLYAPLASWGDVAVGEYRPSHAYPGRSALLGLIAAALGFDRADEPRHQQLDDALTFAVAVYAEGSLLRDYHTAQVPGASDIKKRPHRTRADELAIPRYDLNTILSTRDYRQDALCVVGVWLRGHSADMELNSIAMALQRPQFTLYLGRKACPPALPLSPKIVEAENFRSALAKVRLPEIDERDRLGIPAEPVMVAWEEGADAGWPQSFSVTRKDSPRSRQRWQFADRTERVALTAGAEPSDEAEDERAP
ncbi:MAG: type I-E CRISPR-associated protein Cas5/CasD [Planctomycetia bacterium]|nr:type I-E CRISPR-associated protein Cas5/CasD [Planctomycetia bacterium]